MPVKPITNEFNPSRPPLLSLAQNIGLLAGAMFWGFGCDIFGRRWAFNLTLGITSVFGLIAASSPTGIHTQPDKTQVESCTNKSNVGVIVGGVIGGIFGTVILIAIVVWYWRRGRKKENGPLKRYLIKLALSGDSNTVIGRYSPFEPKELQLETTSIPPLLPQAYKGKLSPQGSLSRPKFGIHTVLIIPLTQIRNLQSMYLV